LHCDRKPINKKKTHTFFAVDEDDD